MPHWLTQILYLIAAVLFIIGLKRLGSPGNGAAAAISSRSSACCWRWRVTLLDPAIVSYWVILAGVAVGTALGLWQAYAVKMTGDAADGGAAERLRRRRVDGGGRRRVPARLRGQRADSDAEVGVVMQLSLLIGAVTFSGSLIAFAKLQELMTGKPITFPGQNAFNAAAVPRDRRVGGVAGFHRSRR